MPTYVQFTRDEFEDWLTSTGHRWKQKTGTVGIYIVPLSDNVGIEVSSSLTGRDDVMNRAQASMGVKLVSLITGFTLNKVAQGQSHFKRTINWRDNLAKGIDRMVDAYRKSSAFYDALAEIADREAYKRDLMGKIESASGWQNNPFLADLHEKLSRDGILTLKQKDALERAVHRAPPPPPPEPPPPPPSEPTPTRDEGLLNRVRALYAFAREQGSQWLLEFSNNVGRMLANGRELSPRQMETLNKLLAEHQSGLEPFLRRQRVAAAYLARRPG